MHNTNSLSYKIFAVFNIIILSIISVLSLLPILNVLAVSLSGSSAAISRFIGIVPVDFSLVAYKKVIEHAQFLITYKNTVIYVIVDTIVSLFLNTIMAYPLSKRFLPGRKVIMKFVVFTMFFGGGMIPNFLLIKSLGLMNTMWSFILPGAIGAYNVIIMRTFFMGIPESLEEAAYIDGMNPFQVLFSIILPLSKPIMATIGLFVAVGAWNNWFGPLIYLNDNTKYPVILFLRNIVMGAELSAKEGTSSLEIETVPVTLRSASIMLVTIPILCVYPFIQKYFVHGVMIGSVKE